MEKEQIKEKLKNAKSVLQIGAIDISIIRDYNRLFKIGIDKNPINRSFFNRFIISDGNYIGALNMINQRVDITLITLPSHEYDVNALAKEAKRFTNGDVIITTKQTNIEEVKTVHFKGIPQDKQEEIKAVADCYNFECVENTLEIDGQKIVDYISLKPKKDKKKRKQSKPISEETRAKMRESALKRKKNKK